MMDGGYEISSASDDEPVRKLFLLLAPGYSIESKAYQRIKVPIRARAQTGEARTRSGRRPAVGSSTKRRTARCLFFANNMCSSLGEEKQATFAYLPSISIGGNGKSW